MAYIRYKDYRVRLPGSRWVRITLAAGLILGGIPPLGMVVPVFGWGTIALGLLILSYDIPVVRRGRRRTEVWGLRWWRRHKHNRTISTAHHIVIAMTTWPFAAIRAVKRWGRHLRSQWPWYRTTRDDIRRTRMRPRRSRRRIFGALRPQARWRTSRSWLARTLPFLR